MTMLSLDTPALQNTTEGNNKNEIAAMCFFEGT